MIDLSRFSPTGFIFILHMLTATGCAAFVEELTFTKTPKQLLGRQIIVTLPDASKPRWQAIAAKIGREYDLALSGEFPLPSIAVNCLVYKVPTRQSIAALLNTLRQDKRVAWAQENQVFEGMQSNKEDVYTQLSYGPDLIHANAAHRLTTGEGISIAIIDTGADPLHPDLSGRILASKNFVEGGEESFAEDRHGTAIAGIIAALTNNGIGIDGIAPNAELHVLKSCWYRDSSDASAQCSSWTLAKALDAAITYQVKIINMSLAGPPDRLLQDLLDEANRQDITIVTASLEKASEPGFPAQLDYVIPAVSAGPDGSVKPPEWLPKLSRVVAAPGVEIVTTAPHGEYEIISGSSLAAAHVSGVVALLLAFEPGLEPREIKNLLADDSLASHDHRPVSTCRVINRIRDSAGC